MNDIIGEKRIREECEVPDLNSASVKGVMAGVVPQCEISPTICN